MPYKAVNIFSKNIRLKSPMVRSDLCDFSYVYIVIKGTINLTNYENVIHRLGQA